MKTPALIFLLAFPFILQSLALDIDLSSKKLAAKVIDSNVTQLQHLSKISLDIECKVEFSADFLKYNPTASTSDQQIQKLEVVLSDSNARFDVSGKMRDGSDNLGYLSIANTEGIQILDRRAGPQLIISKTSYILPHDSYDGKDMLTAMYTFLSHSQRSNDFPTPSLEDIQNPTKWADAFNDFVFNLEQEAKTIQATRHLSDGGWETVRFDPQTLLPIFYNRLDAQKQLIRQYQVTATKQISEGKTSLILPAEIESRRYLKNGWLMTTFHLKLLKANLAPLIDEVSFTIDPMLAARIWDTNTQTLITIPK
jgi:hypothetical protein